MINTNYINNPALMDDEEQEPKEEKQEPMENVL